MGWHKLGGTGLKASTLGLAVVVVVVLGGHPLSAREIEAFVIKEHYGVSHPDQIIDFELNERIEPTKAHMIGPTGRQVVFQPLENDSKVAVRTDLPAGATRTWKLMSGRGPGVRPERDLVRVIEKKQYYEITNGVTGIRIPTEQFQLPSDLTAWPGLFNISVRQPFYLPAPVQGVLLRDGTWTATGPNALEALADEGSGRFDVTFLEKGPLKTVVQIHYVVTTPSYDYGQIHLKDAGPGYHTTTITLTAGSQSIGFEEESNLQVIYGFDVYHGIEPTNGRYRGHHATKKENGYQGDGEVYGMSHARAPMDAQVDFNYRKPKRAAYTSSGPVSQGGYWRRMAVWDPWIFDSGWYWQVFNRAKGADANIAGIFAGRPSRALGAGASGVGINTLPAGKDGTPRLLITVESYRRSASGAVLPKSRFQWGLFIGTKGRDMRPPAEVQPIARQMNLHGGVNLNKLHRLTLDFPDPPKGYGSLYMDKAAIDWRKERVRTDEDYYRFLYNAETYSRSMIDMWRDPKRERLQKMIDSVVEHGHKLVDSLVHGDGIYDFDVHYWHGGLMMMRDGVIIDQILGDSRTSDEDRQRIKAIAALYANVLWDNDFVPLDNEHGLNLGTANMPIQQSGYRNFYAMFMSRHPSMKARAPRVAEHVMGIVRQVVNDDGAEIGCPHYMGASFAPTLSSLLQLKQLGPIHSYGVDPFKAEPRLAKFAEFYMQLMTPPEPRLDGKRGHIPLGDGSIEPCEMLGMLGTGFRDADPQLSRRLMGMWNESGNPHSFFFGTTLAMIDRRLSSTSPNLSDATFPGYMSVLRNGYGTDDETAIWLIAGDWHSDHRHNDHGSVIIYALGHPLSTDWSSIYTPHTPGSYTKSAVVFADSTAGGWAKDSPGLDAGSVWNAGSDQEVLKSFPDGAYTRAFMKTGKTETTTWTREVIKVLPDPQNPIIVLRDSFTGSRAGAEKVMTLNLVAEGTVDTPAGVITPILRRHPNAAHNSGDPQHHRPSTSKTLTLAGGVQCFGFTGSQGIDFNVYTVNDQAQEAVIGNWSAPIWGGHAKGRFESQHLLRIKGSSRFTSVIVPWRKGHLPPGLKVVKENGAVVMVLSDQRITIDSNAYTIEREGRETTREFR